MTAVIISQAVAPRAPFSVPRNGTAGWRSRQGFVLVAIMVIVMLLSMLVVSLLFRFKAEDTAASASTGSEQAWAAAMSGVEEALRVAVAATPGTTSWQNNPGAFRDRLVFDDGGDRWLFTVYSTTAGDDLNPVTYGLTDDASRLNVNHADKESLARLPGMTPELSQALRDSADPDGIARGTAFGGMPENDRLFPATRPLRSGAFISLDELRLVRGFSQELLYGEDANMNGRLDPNEDDGEERPPMDNRDGRLNLGLRQYLCVNSSEPNDTREGLPRVNLNNPNDPLPEMELPAALTNFIAALRGAGLKVRHPVDLLEAAIKVKDANGAEIEVLSGVTKAELALVLDQFTTSTARRLDGLINVNTAGVTVLATVPGIDEALAESIVSTRRAIGPERLVSIAWLLQEGVVDAAQFKAIAPRLTARGFQYRFQVAGYGLPAGRFRVLEVAIDVSGGQKRITYLRDITKLGLPFAFGTDGANAPAPSAWQHRKGARRG